MAGKLPDPPSEAIGRLSRLLASLGVQDFAVTGSVALGVWAVPRETHDIDLCGELPAAAVEPLLALYDGMRAGPGEMPDLVRFRVGDWDVDLFVSNGAYDRTCLERAVQVEVAGTKVKVVTAEDLLIHKLIKLRSDRRRMLQDLADIRSVLDARGDTIDWEYLKSWLPPHEAELLRSVSALDDEALVKRLLGT
ncbi:MAG: nucleotidyltransferase [Deltaproteobacteria bacterium]|nr:nucleotidyltransferase [Deltaproteobacteria bacterium]